MKTTLKLAIAACLTVAANAFTVDFAVQPNGVIPPTLVVNVPGYGDVQFEATFGTLEVGNKFSSRSLQFDQGEVVTITFLGVTPTDVEFGTTGVEFGNEMFVAGGGGTVFTAQLLGAGNGAGVTNVNFNAIPEPSAAILGVVGMAGLVLRRRR